MKKYFITVLYTFLKVMDNFKNELFEAIKNKDIDFIDNIKFDDIEILDAKLFEDESDDPYYNYVKGTYYFVMAQNTEYVNKILINKYYRKAKHYYKSAHKGCNSSNLDLSLGYTYFWLNNNEKMIKYYELASNKNNLDAHKHLGEYYYEEYEDYETAIYYYKRAADQNDLDSYYILGKLYKKLHQIDDAKYYYTLSADNGNNKAQYKLGFIYENMKKDIEEFKKAVYYYTLSADNGNVKAQTMLAVLYDDSLNNDEKAKHYYELAIKNGAKDLHNRLGNLLLRTNRDYFNAFNLYCQSKDLEGNDNIADMINDYNDSKKFIAKKIEKLKNELENVKEENKKLKLKLSSIPEYGSMFNLDEL